MTGTADTEAFEFQSIYNLETVIIPTNRPVQRKDFNDQIFRSAEEKFEAVVKDIAECHKKRPTGFGRYNQHRKLPNWFPRCYTKQVCRITF